MSVANLLKVNILSHKSIQEELVRELQEVALFHLTTVGENPIFNGGDLLDEVDDDSTVDVETALSEIGYAIAAISRYEEKKGLLSGLFSSKIVITGDQLKETVDSFDYRPVLTDCRNVDRERADVQSRISKAESLIHQISPWLSFNGNVEDLEPTLSVYITSAICPVEFFPRFRQELSEFSDLFEVSVVQESRDSMYLLIFAHRDIEEKVRELENKFEIEEIQFPGLRGSFAKIRDRAEKEIGKARQALDVLDRRGVELVRHRQSLEILYDSYSEKLQQKEAMTRFGSTESTILIEGWVAEDDFGGLDEWLTKRFEMVHITKVEPFEGENAPVKLKNSTAMKPFELITELFGMPGKKAVDPTPFLAPFFILFFGICMTDAGYGLITLGFIVFALKKFNIQMRDNKLMWVLLGGSISTIVMGALTGGWWGDIIDKLADHFAANWAVFKHIESMKDSMMVLDPLKQSMMFFRITIALGIVQVIFGLTIKTVKSFRDGDAGAAVFESIPWIFIILGLVTMGAFAPMKMAGTVLALLGAFLVLVGSNRTTRNPFARLASGLYSLYGITGYLSDVLSYSRLLALGLTTGVIGMAVNLIGFIVIEIPVLGWILFVVIFIFGHIANLLISSLGAFVHTIRLQYVEFFPKFYESGGKPFKAFKTERKYTILSE